MVIKRETESAASLLCIDLISEILLRSPAKTLYRWKCVCKNWNTLICSPLFIRRLKLLPPLAAGFFYFDNKAREVKYYCCIEDKLKPIVPAADNHLTVDFCVVASHNGLLLCSELEGNPRRHLVCNPLTRKWICLPQVPPHPGKYDLTLVSYENLNKPQLVDFKVLSFSPNLRSINIHTYSSETGEWRMSLLRRPHSVFNFRFNSSKTLVAPRSDSVYMWNENCPEVCVYDQKKENLRFYLLPRITDDFFEGWDWKHVMGVSSGSVYYARMKPPILCVWSLEGGSKLKHRISLQEEPTFELLAFHPLRLGVVLNKGLLYEVETGTVKFIPADVHLPLSAPFVPYLLPAWLPEPRESK